MLVQVVGISTITGSFDLPDRGHPGRCSRRSSCTRRCRRWKCSLTISRRSRCASTAPKARCWASSARSAGPSLRSETCPKPMVSAILAAEDERFYQHRGVDYIGVGRAALSNFVSGGVRQGASTITMQVARNFFLTKERTVTRKFNEMLLAFKIEASLTQGRDPPALREPDLSRPARVRLRGRLADLFRQTAGKAHARRVRDARRPAEGAVELQPDRQPEARAAAPAVRAAAHARARHDHRSRARRKPRSSRSSSSAARTISRVHAEHFAEMVRQAVYERYKDETYSRGIRVYTTRFRAPPGSGVSVAAARRAGVRPPPRLPRAGRLRGASRRS